MCKSSAVADAEQRKRQRLQDGSHISSPSAADADAAAEERCHPGTGSNAAHSPLEQPFTGPQQNAVGAQAAASDPAKSPSAAALSQHRWRGSGQHADEPTGAGAAMDLAAGFPQASGSPATSAAPTSQQTPAAHTSPAKCTAHDAGSPAARQRQHLPGATAAAPSSGAPATQPQAQLGSRSEAAEAAGGAAPPLVADTQSASHPADRQQQQQQQHLQRHSSRRPAEVPADTVATAAMAARQDSPAPSGAGVHDMLMDGITQDDVHLHFNEVWRCPSSLGIHLY